MQRTFLDWSTPLLAQAADWLIDRGGTGPLCDLSGIVVVVPGRRAGRRLLELLVADERCGELVPPRVETVGTFPELLYEARYEFADNLIQNLVWSESLRAADREDLQAVVPRVPATEDTQAWVSLADLIRQQHRELAADQLNFADVADACRKSGRAEESRRWSALHRVQRDYFSRMDGMCLWDRQTARLEAVRRNECRTDQDIALIGTVDLNRVVQAMIEQIADRVTALISAPPEMSDRFDAFGGLIADAWEACRIDLRTDQVIVADRPDDQAARVVEHINQFAGRYRADEITVGVADERLVPHLQRHFEECNVATRWFEGKRLAESPPFRLFERLAEFVTGLLPGQHEARAWHFDAFAALVRHPDLYQWITENFAAPPPPNGKPEKHWLIQLDEYRANHLQPRPGFWIRSYPYHESLEFLWSVVGNLVVDFAPPDDAGRLFADERRLFEWATPIRKFLKNIYASRRFRPDDGNDTASAEAIRRLDEVLSAFEGIPRPIAPVVNAAQAIQLMLKECRRDYIPPPHDDSAVDLLGWLELSLDDAPALIVTTFNERFVPKSVTSDLFLPNRLRRELNLNDNTQRYARDAYAMHVLLASKESATFVVGRRDDHDDPLAPSRLLFATDPKEIPQRVLEFYPEQSAGADVPIRSRMQPGRRSSNFIVPRPEELTEPITRLRVTAFRSYLECPYRFYLKHILKLREVTDEPRELHPGQFGTLLHDVLDRFGRNPEIRDALNAEDIRSFLNAELERVAARRFGRVRTAAVNVQIHRMRMRLERFAVWQADWAGQGYRIRYAEDGDSESKADCVHFPLGDGRSLELSGRIDRVDQREGTDEWVIFDYKSSDAAKSPRDTHTKRNIKGPDRWTDLQMPLYRHLAASLPIDHEGPFRLGYILLPGDLDRIGESLAGWSDDSLREADEVAGKIGRRILDQEFWPPAASVMYPDFERICQDGVFDREVPV